MKIMQRFLLLPVLFALVVFAVPTRSWADDANTDGHANDPQKSKVPNVSTTAVDAGTIIDVNRQHGTDQTGGGASGIASSDSTATGAEKAQVKVNATGIATGFDTSSSTEAKSTSRAVVTSAFDATGRTTTGEVHGATDQVNWGTLDQKNGNFVDGWNATTSSYDASANSTHHDLSGSGKSLSDGTTVVTMVNTEDRAQTNVNSFGKSSAEVDLGREGREKDATTPAVKASGFGGIDAQSIIGGPADKVLAGAGIYANAAYQDAGPKSAAGSMDMTGFTLVVIKPDSVSATGTAQSVALAGTGKPSDNGGHGNGSKH